MDRIMEAHLPKISSLEHRRAFPVTPRHVTARPRDPSGRYGESERGKAKHHFNLIELYLPSTGTPAGCIL